MPVTVDWDDEARTIVRMNMIGSWTWEEAYAGADNGYAILDSVPYEVGVIIDFSQGAGLPPNAILNARNMIHRRHPRTGLTVFVGTNSMFTALWNIFSRVYTLLARKQNSVFASSVDEARQILAAVYQRDTQPPDAQSA